MIVKSGQSLSVGFVTLYNGEATAATGTPTVVLYVNGASNGATVTVSGSNPYVAALTFPSLSAGDVVQLYCSAAVSTKNPAGFIFTAIADTARLSELATAASISALSIPTAAQNATQVRTELTTELARIDVATSTRASASAVSSLPTAAAIADAVYDEAYADHKIAGTFGKLFDILRKHMHIVEGTVASGATPTTTTFRTNLTAATGAYNHQYLVFLDGALVDQGSPVYTYTQTNGAVLLQEALTAAPSVGDTFVILPYHVHPTDSIGAAVQQAIQASLDSLDSGIQGVMIQVSDGGDLYELVQGIDSTVSGAFNDGNYTYSDTIRYNGSGVDGVEVIAYSDEAMTTFLAKTTTNSLGQFTIRSDVAGTAYLIFQHADYTFNVTVPQEVTLA